MEVEKQICINNLSNVHHLCRACLTKSKQMTQLDTKYEGNQDENSTIWDVLQCVVGMKIKLDKQYPSYICPMCTSLLKVCYKFKLQFEQSQQLLGNYFGETQTVIEPLQYSHLAEVDLISNKGVYDLKEVLVIEEEKEGDEVPNFDGFLKNLGKEISASFVNTNCVDDSPQDNTHHEEIAELNNSYSNNNNIETATDESINNLKDCSNTSLYDSVSCAICDKSFYNKHRLKHHIKAVHNIPNDTFVCEICGIIKTSRSGHHHHSEKRYSCSFCTKSYFNSATLQQHVSAIHKNNRVYLCTICGKTFNYSNALTYHMRIHTDERQYQCTYCGKMFRIQCGLDRHLRTHTGLRPYKCKYCDKAFKSKGEVDCHEMTHTGYRPYHCKYCERGFTKTYNLKIHLLSHKGPHACDVCNKTFIEREFLKIHIESTHLGKMNLDDCNVENEIT